MTRLARIRQRGTALALVTAVVVVFGGAGLSSAQETAEEGVVARVDGDPITEDDLAVGIEEFRDQVLRMPGDPRSNLIDLLVNIRLVAKAAEEAGIDEDPAVAAQLALARNRVLYGEFLRHKFVDAVTEEAVHAKFDEELAAFVPADEVHVRHILVATEQEAKDIIAALDAGADFAELAKEKSSDGSASRGGDLDFIGPGQTVQPFEDAAYALEIGAYTKEPVQSRFGWHVIKAEEARKQPTPTFEQEARRIQNEMLATIFNETVEALRTGVTIEVVPLAAPEPGAEEQTPEMEADPADGQ